MRFVRSVRQKILFPAQVGYGFFEPLINGIKGLMVLGISAMALIGAIEALFSGGRLIALGIHFCI